MIVSGPKVVAVVTAVVPVAVFVFTVDELELVEVEVVVETSFGAAIMTPGPPEAVRTFSAAATPAWTTGSENAAAKLRS
jgi:hypothetical protein